MTNSSTNTIDLTSLDGVFGHFRITNAQRQREIIRLVEEFQQIENSFCALFGFDSETFMFLSPSVGKLLGYPITDFANKGFKFFFGITPPEFMPHIMQKQAGFVKRALTPGFNYRKPFFIDIDAALFHKNGEVKHVHQEGVCLEFEPGGDYRNFFAVWILTDKMTIAQQAKMKSDIREKLRYFHRLIFAPGIVMKNVKKVNSLVSLQTPASQVPRLTVKEKELLSLLAKGRSLKEVAQQMKVSYFTAESHRKSIFKKFGAKNVAELIKKASKIYWLE